MRGVDTLEYWQRQKNYPTSRAFFIAVRPPSTNTYYRKSRQGHMYLSPAGRRFRNVVHSHLEKCRWKARGRVHMTMDFYFKGVVRRDIDNYIKPTIDAFKDKVMGDDECVDKLTVRKAYNCAENYIYVCIREITEEINESE